MKIKTDFLGPIGLKRFTCFGGYRVDAASSTKLFSCKTS